MFFVLPGVQLLDIGGPAQALYAAARMGAGYQLVFCGADSQVISAQGLHLANLEPVEKFPAPDLILIPGISSHNNGLAGPLIGESVRQWLRRLAASGTPIASVCTGAFALAEAGLLAGRRCTTHWANIPELQARYPDANVLDNVLFIRDGSITTSAGIASGIDMALWLLEQDMGPLFAAQIARQLVVYLRRTGTQTQQSVYLEYRTHLHTGVHRAQDFIIAHMHERIKLEQIADAAQLAERTLSRTFKENIGLTPIQYQQVLRLNLARNLLDNPQFNIADVAEQCGFEDVRHFRRLWKAHYGSAPSAVRLRSGELND